MELTLDLRSIPLVYRELCGHQALAIGLFCSIEGLSLRILEVPLGFFIYMKLNFMKMVLFVIG